MDRPDNVPTGGPWESSYPIQDALNYQDYRHTGNTYWAPNAVPATPTSADITEYKNDLVTDIDVNYPFANNEYAAPNHQLQKQPPNTMIMHWFAANGYNGAGTYTYFADPGWGGGTVSENTTHDVVVAIGGRGFIW